MEDITENHHQLKWRVMEPNVNGYIDKTIPVPKARVKENIVRERAE